ncbi:anti-sigma regulatory factor (Ser/Thr protein kinase) [Motilibacter rhizosphaerae]|uniref:Anti-sigma regulatory factor (Ser/Thr protein kinase) n=1 Tax=Motilibacter rhizosphaerae TaxID=598652 RepID=A0A4Q7NVM6_9ACTN|nr:ATP-binding protein [Motilibacter rhizosphaerae]RZS90928.1 anti-sigma regulatory factor (Ser/Thr protein kinase) [Motilibacter rhizosphaerae]
MTAGQRLTLALDLPLGPEACAVARRTVRDALSAWGVGGEGLAYDATLVVTELVSNGVRHGGDAVRLELATEAGCLEVAVVDGSAVLPEARGSDGESEGGRGVAIIEAVSRRWGVQALGEGKRVWAEIARG